MSDQFNEKHLLWWVLKAVSACRAEGVRPDTLVSETLWKNLGAPDWVLPAMVEKYKDFGLPRFGHKIIEGPWELQGEVVTGSASLGPIRPLTSK